MKNKFHFIVTGLLTLLLTLNASAALGPNLTSIFNDHAPDKLERVMMKDLQKTWYAFPATSASGMFRPVFLNFTYTCKSGPEDSNQPLTFPCLLSFKFDFICNTYEARRPGFIFRRDPEALKITLTDSKKIADNIRYWGGTHAIWGELIQSGAGFGGTVFVFNRVGPNLY